MKLWLRTQETIRQYARRAMPRLCPSEGSTPSFSGDLACHTMQTKACGEVNAELVEDRTLSLDPFVDEDVVAAVPDWSEVRPLAPKSTTCRVASISNPVNSTKLSVAQGSILWRSPFCCGCGPRLPICCGIEETNCTNFANVHVEAFSAIQPSPARWDDPQTVPETARSPRQDDGEETEFSQHCTMPELDRDQAQQFQSMQNEMLLLQQWGELQKAADLGERLLKLRHLKQGPTHLDSLRLASSLGNIFHGLGMLDKAEKMYQEVLYGRDTVLGSDHIETLRVVNDIACVLEAKGKHRAAERVSRLLLERLTKALGASHPDTARCAENLGSLLEEQGRWEAAEPFYRMAAEAFRDALGAQHSQTVASLYRLACALEAKGSPNDAVPLFREVLAANEAQLGPDHPETRGTVYSLALALEALGRCAEAENLFRLELSSCERMEGFSHRNTRGSLRYLARFLRTQGRHQEAKELVQRLASPKGTASAKGIGSCSASNASHSSLAKNALLSF